VRAAPARARCPSAPGRADVAGPPPGAHRHELRLNLGHGDGLTLAAEQVGAEQVALRAGGAGVRAGGRGDATLRCSCQRHAAQQQQKGDFASPHGVWSGQRPQQRWRRRAPAGRKTTGLRGRGVRPCQRRPRRISAMKSSVRSNATARRACEADPAASCWARLRARRAAARRAAARRARRRPRTPHKRRPAAPGAPWSIGKPFTLGGKAAAVQGGDIDTVTRGARTRAQAAGGRAAAARRAPGRGPRPAYAARPPCPCSRRGAEVPTPGASAALGPARARGARPPPLLRRACAAPPPPRTHRGGRARPPPPLRGASRGRPRRGAAAAAHKQAGAPRRPPAAPTPRDAAPHGPRAARRARAARRGAGDLAPRPARGSAPAGARSSCRELPGAPYSIF
jgi:hypothetical protein